MHGSASPLSSSSPGQSMLGIINNAAKEGALGSASSPIHMVSAEGGFKQQFWRTVRTLAVAFLLISGLGAVFEDRGIRKGQEFSLIFHFDISLCFEVDHFYVFLC